jgi:hypothetical protein
MGQNTTRAGLGSQFEGMIHRQFNLTAECAESAEKGGGKTKIWLIRHRHNHDIINITVPATMKKPA